MITKGLFARCIYNGGSAVVFFIMFQQLGQSLNVDITLFDE